MKIWSCAEPPPQPAGALFAKTTLPRLSRIMTWSERGLDDRLQQCDLAVTGLRRARQSGDVAPEQDQAVFVGQDGETDRSSRAEGGSGFELDRPVALDRLVDRGAIARAGDQIPEMLPQAFRPGPAERLEHDFVDVDYPAVTIDQKIFVAGRHRAPPASGSARWRAHRGPARAARNWPRRRRAFVVQRAGRRKARATVAASCSESCRPYETHAPFISCCMAIAHPARRLGRSYSNSRAPRTSNPET